ncbi:MAG: adenylate/guanylate cyclase domain-containing protein [Thaumarchaeota archaeon]|nr:adenylate/guanylate cyclase domain-containing protein [Nitrososphaerota archaeon]
MEYSDEPEVRYAKSGDIHIAYEVYGNGPVNLVLTPGSISHLNYYWKEASTRRWLEGLGRFARVARFDKRGTGLSDREGGIPTYEERMEDIRAVMDAAGFDEAVLVGFSDGVPMSILFAASYPSRTRCLVLYGGFAKGSWAPDYPWAATKEQMEQSFERTERTWGTKEAAERRVSILAPSRLGDAAYIHWMGENRRMGGSPGAAIALAKAEMNIDVRSILPTIHVPTLVIHLTDDKVCSVEEGRYIAAHIPGARMLELPGRDHMFCVDAQLTDRILGEIQKFATGVEPPPTRSDRMLATVLFTDIVGSTRRAAELGDSKWQALLAQHDSMVRNNVERFSGSVIKSTGDGFLATFEGPSRAIGCAWSVTRSAGELDIEVRAGIHTGECILGSTDISGIAIHMASRILDEALPGEVLVSSTVRDLVYGSRISFNDRGEHELKGIEDKRHLFSVTSID